VFQQVWCHGAAGIALSRLRAYEILGDPALLDEARIGLATTLQAVRRAGSTTPTDYSLCHGVLGQVDVLLEGLPHLSTDDAIVRQLLERVLQNGATHAKRHGRWPCGDPAGSESPGLMLGLAGIGYAHLRLAAGRTVPSVLLPMPSQLGESGAARTAAAPNPIGL
jgi:lantibiotic modifying enzyme